MHTANYRHAFALLVQQQPVRVMFVAGQEERMAVHGEMCIWR